jgi:hypothetical protein
MFPPALRHRRQFQCPNGWVTLVYCNGLIYEALHTTPSFLSFSTYTPSSYVTPSLVLFAPRSA